MVYVLPFERLISFFSSESIHEEWFIRHVHREKGTFKGEENAENIYHRRGETNTQRDKI